MHDVVEINNRYYNDIEKAAESQIPSPLID